MDQIAGGKAGVYDPSIFTRVASLQAAKKIILTNEATLTTDQRWQVETPHIADLICRQVRLDAESVVLDYGCGVGRIAKELIRRSACTVVGVDISPNMRALATSYVPNSRFIACDPDMLDLIKPRAHLAVAVWVLQHVSDFDHELGRIRDSLAVHGVLFVVNEASRRFVPTTAGWIDDGIDVRARLSAEFKVLAEGKLDPAVVGVQQSERTFWAAYVV